MLIEFASVLVFSLFALGFVLLNLTISRLLAPRLPNALKEIPYECGELPVGNPYIRFNPRYYFYALVFLIFDAELALTFPCIVVYKRWVEKGMGKAAFYEIFSFVAILVIGFAYLWSKGYLTWVKTPSTHVEQPSITKAA